MAAVVNNYYGASAAERIYLFNDGFYPYWDYYSPFSFSSHFGLGYGFGLGFGWGYPYYGDTVWRYYSVLPVLSYYGYGYGGYYDPYWVMAAATHTTVTAVVITRLITMTNRAICSRRGGYSTTTRDHIQLRVMAEANQLYPLRALTQEGAGRHHLLLHLQHRWHSPEQAPKPGGADASEKAHIQGLHQFEQRADDRAGTTRRDRQGPVHRQGTQSATSPEHRPVRRPEPQTGTQTRTSTQGPDTECEQTSYRQLKGHYTPSYTVQDEFKTFTQQQDYWNRSRAQLTEAQPPEAAAEAVSSGNSAPSRSSSSSVPVFFSFTQQFGSSAEAAAAHPIQEAAEAAALRIPAAAGAAVQESQADTAAEATAPQDHQAAHHPPRHTAAAAAAAGDNLYYIH